MEQRIPSVDEINASDSQLQTAEQQNQDLNEQHRQILARFYDQIALYSAGTLSFTATAALPLIFAHPASFERIYFGFRLLWILYISWAALLSALLTALISKKFDAHQTGLYGTKNLLEKLVENHQMRFNYLSHNPDANILPKADIRVITENYGVSYKSAKKMLTEVKKTQAERFDNMRALRKASELLMVLGMILLLTLVIGAIHAFLYP